MWFCTCLLSFYRFLLFAFIENIISWAEEMKDVLLDREDCNAILIDWSDGATGPYGQAAGNTRLVGVQVAELIRFLISSNSGPPGWADRFYVVGFSLGAQIAGYAGRNLRENGMVLGRITGKPFAFLPNRHNRTIDE